MTIDPRGAQSPALSRRRFLALLGMAGGGLSLLSACVQTGPASPAPAAKSDAKPTEAPKPAGAASPAGSPAAVASPGVAASPVAAASPAPSPAAQAAPATGVAAQEVLIGVAYPLSGPTAPAGLDAKTAVELAQDIVNTRNELPLLLAPTEGLPNLGGAKVRAIVTDHQGDPARGAAEAERLITQEKVAAMFGMFQSAVTASASQVAERLSVPYLTAESSSPTLHTRGFKWFFRTSPHDVDFSEAMFGFLKDLEGRRNVKTESVALVYEDTLFGQDSGKVERELAEKAGYKIALDLQYRSRATSLTAEVQRLKAADPDVWFPTSYVSDAILMVQHSKELDYNPKMVLAQNSGHTEAAFIEQAGRDAEGYASRAVFVPDLADKKPVIRQVNDLFKARSGRDMTDVPGRVLLGFLVLCDAINRAGSVEPERVRQALLATNVSGDQLPLPWQGVKFDPATGQNELHTPIVVQLQGGRYWTVWPFDIAARDFIHPIPRWSERR